MKSKATVCLASGEYYCGYVEFLVTYCTHLDRGYQVEYGNPSTQVDDTITVTIESVEVNIGGHYMDITKQITKAQHDFLIKFFLNH